MAKRVRPLVAKVIIIDDDRRNAALLRVWLEAKGYRCLTVKDEKEAEARSEVERPVGIFYATEFRFQFLRGKPDAHHVYEDASRIHSEALVK